MARWAYDPRSRRYRNLDTGQYVARSTVLDWTEEFLTVSGDSVAGLADLLVNGALTVGDWQGQMREEVKRVYIAEYVAGRGGLQQMTPRDWGIIGRALRDQYHYLDNFAAEVAAGELSPAQIKARARMYIEASHAAFERATAEAWGMPRLPAYPSDGQTTCLTNCRCDWINIREVRNSDGTLHGWEATWKLDDRAEHCADCPANAALWNPLFIPAGMTVREAEVWRAREVTRMLQARAVSGYAAGRFAN